MAQYAIDPTQPFPKKWFCKDGGKLSVMAGPVSGYLMVRRPNCIPFVLHVREILNTNSHHLGPFTLSSTSALSDKGESR